MNIFLFEANNVPSFCPLRDGVLLSSLDEKCPRHAKVKLCKACKDISVDTLTW